MAESEAERANCSKIKEKLRRTQNKFPFLSDIADFSGRKNTYQQENRKFWDSKIRLAKLFTSPDVVFLIAIVNCGKKLV